MKAILGIILLLLTANSIQAQKITTRVYKNSNGQELSLDIYQPKRTASSVKKPVIILFHGGGLVGGNRNAMKSQCSFFSERGLVAVSPSYSLLTKDAKDLKSQVQQCIKDAKSAVRWVKQNASEFDIDTNTVFLGGGSAGGFLATEAALMPEINEKSDDLSISTKAKALVLYNPAYAPESKYGPSVINAVSETSPPAILFFGSEDTFKPGGDKFYNMLAKAKVASELWVARGEKHGFFNKEGWQEATNRKAYNFLLKLNLLKEKGVREADTAYSLHLQNPE